jgi:Flp pilus assembly protein TadD
VLLAQEAEDSGQHAAALEKWKESVLLRPESEAAHSHLAACLARLGRREEAREACARALEIDPANALALKTLEALGK